MRPATAAESRERVARLRDLLRDLPAAQREAIDLRGEARLRRLAVWIFDEMPRSLGILRHEPR
jgi:hypothetical protein